jgi:hypothetical protein
VTDFKEGYRKRQTGEYDDGGAKTKGRVKGQDQTISSLLEFFWFLWKQYPSINSNAGICQTKQFSTSKNKNARREFKQLSHP